MSSNFWKFLLIFILATLAGVVQITVLPSIHPIFPLLLNLPLLFFTILIFFSDLEDAILSAFVFGLFLDFYSQLFFGFFILVFIIEVLALKFFIHNIFQNKNINSLLIINLPAIVIWHLLYFILLFISAKFKEVNWDYYYSWQCYLNIVLQFIVHIIIIFLLAKIIRPLKNQLQPTIINL